MQETWVQSLGWEDPLEEEMAPHSSTLAWKTLWTESSRIQGSLQRESQVWVTEAKVSKSQGCASSVASVVSHSLRPMDCSPLDSTAHGILQAKIWSGLPCLLPGDLPSPGIKPVSPVSTALQANSLPTEPPGKPRGQEMDV